MKLSIVLTTIQSPTKCVRNWGNLRPGEIIAVGDKRTPAEWRCDGVHYLSLTEQESCSFKSCRILPYNHYCRKIIGYLKAMENDSDFIFDTDDDNDPYSEFWDNRIPLPQPDESCLLLNSEAGGFINVYSYFSNSQEKIWPRGFPLSKIGKSQKVVTDSLGVESLQDKVGIWQGLVNGDPDVDAIHRLVFGEGFQFSNHSPIILQRKTYSPFNSQNTLWSQRRLFPLLYLPTTVTFRYTDILRSYVAQSIMEKLELLIGFTSPTANQERNAHDYMQDFESEYPMYLQAEFIMNELSKVTTPDGDVIENLVKAYTHLLKIGVVKREELEILNCWISDISNFDL